MMVKVKQWSILKDITNGGNNNEILNTNTIPVPTILQICRFKSNNNNT